MNDASSRHQAASPERRPARPYVPTEAAKRDSRVFEHTHASRDMADHAALGYFQVNDQSLLRREVVRRGWRRFILFGPAKKTFRYTLRPIYKKLLAPFLQEVFDLAGLDIHANVGLRGSTVRVNLTGADRDLLLEDGRGLLDAVETIAKLYASRKVFLPKGTRFHFECGPPSARGRGRDQGRDAARDNGADRARDQDRDGGRRERPRDQAPRDQAPREEAARDQEPREAAPEGPSPSSGDDEVNEDFAGKVERAKMEVLSSGEPRVLKFLNPDQRRHVHRSAEGEPRLKTRSLGDGYYKRVEIGLAPEASPEAGTAREEEDAGAPDQGPPDNGTPSDNGSGETAAADAAADAAAGRERTGGSEAPPL